MDDKCEEMFGMETVPVGASPTAVMIHRLSRLLISEVDDLLKAHSDLSLAGWRVLMGIGERKKLSQKELVEYSRVEQAQVSRALTSLEKRSFIKTEVSEHDRRIKLYSLTEEGNSYFQSLSPVITEHHARITAALSEEEFESFLDMCTRIAGAATKNRP